MSKAKSFNLDDVFSKAEKKEKSRTVVPDLKVPFKVAKMVDEIRALKEQEESLSAKVSVLKDEILQEIAPLREKQVIENGYSPTVRIHGTDGNSILISYTEKYSKIPVEHYQYLAEALGEDTPKFFAKKLSINVKEDLSEEMLEELVRKIGPERFSEFFEVQRWIEPTQKFTRERVFFPQEVKDKLSPFVTQATPTLKIK